jgi:hypothetical protein
MKKLLSALILLSACSAQKTSPIDALRGDDAKAREAIDGFVARGPAAIPDLKAAAEDADPTVRRRAKTALGRITGQWGSDGRFLWRRDLKDAVNQGKPILVLQLFGKFDEEFC